MPRPKLYLTDEERRAASCEASKRYYRKKNPEVAPRTLWTYDADAIRAYHRAYYHRQKERVVVTEATEVVPS